MPSDRRCPRCLHHLPTDAPDGLCSSCLPTEHLDGVRDRHTGRARPDETRTWDELCETVSYRADRPGPDAPGGKRKGSAPIANVDFDPFARSLVESGLMEQAEVESFLVRFPPRARPGEAERLARELVRAGRLTEYQAGALLQGKSRGLVIDDYLILDKVGAGGMGMVFKARHRRMKRVVALKLLPPSFTKNRGAVIRFEREAEAAARLSHPNIVAALDAGEFNGLHYFAMEYVEGSDLTRLVKKEGPLSVGRAIDCLVQAARGLKAAHARGIYHRDIKPSNLLLDPGGTLKVLDLGLARIERECDILNSAGADPSLTREGAMMGTVDFMAPEQALNSKDADQRSDIYSLGCTLYYLLTGRTPYSGPTLIARLLAHREHPIPRLCDVRPDVPPGLDAALRCMLAKSPEDRYPSIDALIAELEACRSPGTAAEDGPGPTASPSVVTEAVGPSRRWSRTRRLRAAAVVAGVSLVAVLGAVVANHMRVGQGELVIEGGGPDVAVTVKQRGWVVIPPTHARRFDLEVGIYQLELAGTSAGLRPEPERFAIRRKDRTVVNIERVPPAGMPAPPSPPVLAEETPKEAPPPIEPVGEVRRFPGHEHDRVEGVAVATDGRHALSAGYDWTVRLWELSTGREPRRFIHDGPVFAVAFSPDNHRALSASGDRTVRLWDLDDGREVGRFEGHTGPVYAVAFAPDGRRILSGSGDKSVRLWDVERRGETQQFLHDGPVTAVAFSPDGQQALSGSSDRTVRLWDLRVGTAGQIRRLGCRAPVWSLAFSADGHRALSGSGDPARLVGDMTLWNLDRGEVIRRFDDALDWVRCVAFLRDGRRALSGTQAGQLVLWDIEEGRALHRFEGSAGRLGLAVLPDGLHALTSDADGLVRLWNLPGPGTSDPGGRLPPADGPGDPEP